MTLPHAVVMANVEGSDPALLRERLAFLMRCVCRAWLEV
jgi:hypothetical protein